MGFIEDGYPVFSKEEWKAIPGAQAGALILESIHSGTGSKNMWSCHCLACGNKTIKREDRLRTGAIGGVVYSSGRKDNGVRSCGCKQAKIFKAPNITGIAETKYTENTLSGLKILYKTEFRDFSGASVVMCECPLCGKAFPTTTKSNRNNCGCRRGSVSLSLDDFLKHNKCKSKGEKTILKMLESVSVPVEMEKRFMNCKDDSLLPFDFYLESPRFGKYVIEFDGRQHFKNIEWFGGIEIIRKHDLIKNRFCWENGIKIIRIPYDAEFVLNDLSLATTRFLLTPQNEKEYYESRR